MNNILVKTKKKRKHNEIVKEVLRRIEANNLYMKPKKCIQKVKYYGITSKKEIISYIFINLIENIQEYNIKRIQIAQEGLCKIYIVLSKGYIIVGDKYID